ncbi:type 11 methyltransferase [Streptomyces mobaraensis NBRC 13819 = DSM 40847]|uniref:Type 11 methyltransferase n=2 Tax=Streptomyces mobaraensis TaxID=35621 RepID=M3C4Y7_STRM1|nr:type 11 methyltransferase [Streptomyces mobaraensis NBRC 13819 = DSM 40847]
MIDDMPRGGPGAAWWDRLYETDRPEYLDRADAAGRRRRVLRGLDRLERLTLAHRTCGGLVLDGLRDVPRPRFLELGAGGGGLARWVLDRHPAARATVSDVAPDLVEALRAGPLGRHARATVERLDATAIDAPDGSYDLALFSRSLHHLPPRGAADVLREGTRVARRLLVIDLWRHPVCLAAVPPAFLCGGPAQAHDAVVSLRKAYSPAALRHLAAACGAPVALRTRFLPPLYLAAVATRRG